MSVAFGWHRLRRCSRVNPLPQGMRLLQALRSPVCGSGFSREEAGTGNLNQPAATMPGSAPAWR
ncbi:hypothetical protein D0O09_22635 [Pseudomonas putida]|nr:hypothetical protein D0O09_22635 [Pseudomonas putida]